MIPSMAVRTPFERLCALPSLAPFAHRGSQTRHAVLSGLLGASRSLLAGALGLARSGAICAGDKRASKKDGTSVVLFVVEGPEAALDALNDLRTFTALHEAAGSPASVKTGRAEKLASASDWEDRGAPSALSLPEELRRGLALECSAFPAWDVLPTESDRPEGMTLAGRRTATDRLREIRNPVARRSSSDQGGALNDLPQTFVLIAPITALMQPTESPGESAAFIRLRTGTEHDPILLGRQLGDAGYERVGQVEVRGEFALRGGILDIFPYTSETPYRLDFFGETIESIKPFNPMSQRSEESVDEISFADASPDSLKKLFSPGAAAGPYALLDHLPAGTLLVLQDPHRLRQRAELYAASLVSGRSILFDLETLLARAREKFESVQLIDEFDSSKNLDAPADDSKKPAQPHVETFPQLSEDAAAIPINCKTVQRLQGEISHTADAWKRAVAEREQTFVVCETPGHRTRLQVLFNDAGVVSGEKNGLLHISLGKLSGGFDLRDAGLLAISDREILGLSKHALSGNKSVALPKKKATPGTVAIQHLMDLQIGDYVVHAAHGIARYLGLARLEKTGRTEDYLTLLFNNEVKLYVPATHIGWVSKYIGGHANIELSTIGSKVWARKKQRAAVAIRDIAEDLLRVQAVRRNLPGIVYPPDGEWQEQFEEAFPYDETVDQIDSIAAVKKDMEATCPMDRLICGDVGFGKTEVALRAAFKATASGKQVAVLAPTTLLAEQHGRTFKERFAGYPFTVEVLSRFKTPAQQKRLLERLANGRVDVVIGTHRLLQKDVRFKDLGLAVIDEEQRFGVEHKEFFKQLRRSIDVLTLTATPIPRTLHMALLGLRDISNLTTPPRNRRSITTKVARVSDDLLRRAILREISRGGQVFVVHPRVHDILEFRDQLAGLVPEARFAVGHGQLDADDLEEVMDSFLKGDVDVLVSTTIVESGLDIPNANTILIHEANKFGLSELHQLRGRVGRSDLQAYCYLLLPEKSGVTPEGLRRLRALEEFDELGAGFQLALKDLEIRGAGNVLGRQQSGEIVEVGYDLYCKLLDASVRELRGEVREEEIEVNLQLRGAAYVPEEYVQDDKVVLEIYRRLDDSHTDAEIDGLRADLVDRFGPLPGTAQRMFDEAKLRRHARLARVPYIGLDNEEGRIIFKLHGWDLKDADRAMHGIAETKGVRVLDGQTFSFAQNLRSKHDEAALRDLVSKLLQPLVNFRTRVMQSNESSLIK